jgi:hypothetical protein
MAFDLLFLLVYFEINSINQPVQVQFTKITRNLIHFSFLVLVIFCFPSSLIVFFLIIWSFRDDDAEKLRTVECLRGRLQAERIASKEAEEVTQVIGKKVKPDLLLVFPFLFPFTSLFSVYLSYFYLNKIGSYCYSSKRNLPCFILFFIWV